MGFTVHSPFVLNGLYDEPKCWTDCIHVFIHQALDNCGFSGIVQPAYVASDSWLNTLGWSTHSIKILISLSFSRALRKIESIVSLAHCVSELGVLLSAVRRNFN